MNNDAFTIGYDGAALRNHSMDVRDLAPALLSLSQLFDEANTLLNGDKTSVKLQVKAVEAGSFQILFELSQSFASHISDFLSGEFITSALNLKELIFCGTGGLFWFIKKLKGKKPDKVIDLKNGIVQIQLGKEIFEIPKKLLQLYESHKIRQSVEKTLSPLKQDGIDTFKVTQQDKLIETVSKDEVDYFKTPDDNEDEVIELDYEGLYSIDLLAFKGRNKWHLHDGDTTISAVMKDEAFNKKIKEHIPFSDNDTLRCKIRKTQRKTKSGLKVEYAVLEVKEHIRGAKQMSLFDDENKPPSE